jgi:hypothetical protein
MRFRRFLLGHPNPTLSLPQRVVSASLNDLPVTHISGLFVTYVPGWFVTYVPGWFVTYVTGSYRRTISEMTLITT